MEKFDGLINIFFYEVFIFITIALFITIASLFILNGNDFFI